MKRFVLALALFGGALPIYAGSEPTLGPNPIERSAAPSKWEFKLAAPIWLAGTKGDSGFAGRTTEFDLSADDILRHVDMTAALRAEASRGRFGVLGEFLYLSLSDGMGATDRVAKKVDFQLDQTMGDMALRWRLAEGKRGWIDLLGGARYTCLYQKAVFQPNDQRIDEVSGKMAAAVTALRAKALKDFLVASGYRPQLPLGPLDSDQQRQLLAAVQKVKGNTEECKQAIAKLLRKAFSSQVSRQEQWWDPYVGLRARYNLPRNCYLSAKGDIGGFGVGSQLSWQASAAVGWQFATHAYAELGYKALGIDYEENGFTYNVVTRGVELTLGLQF